MIERKIPVRLETFGVYLARLFTIYTGKPVRQRCTNGKKKCLMVSSVGVVYLPFTKKKIIERA